MAILNYQRVHLPDPTLLNIVSYYDKNDLYYI